jgi:hypothetical protein
MMCHATVGIHEDGCTDAVKIYNNATATMNPRGHTRVLDYFRDYRLVEPGLVLVPRWRPEEPVDPDLRPIGFYGGVARKDG